MKYNFPSQKKLYTQKTDSWRKEHLDWVEEIIFMKDSGIRISLQQKLRNYRSYLGKINLSDYKTITNPGGLRGAAYIDEKIQHYPIAVPYLNVLIGEEFDRRFEWKAVCTNPNSISKIEEAKRDLLRNKIAELLENKDLSEEEAEEQLKNFNYYLKFEYQDVREKRANLLLKHFIKELDLKLKFNKGFKDVMLVSEEGYIADIVNGNPVIEALDPKKTFVLRAGNSNRYEDADVIVIFDHWSPGQIQDRYYKYLSDKDTKWLDCEPNDNYGKVNGSDLERDERGINILRNQVVDDILQITDFNNGDYTNIKSNEITDEFGNVRVIRLYWRSKKLIKRVKFYDEQGQPQYDYFSETYIPNKERGEEVEDYWVSQWWEGVKIGKDIYPYVRPREIQYNKFSDPGYNHPGVVGQIYNTGGLKATSMMDRAMPYQLLYDATFHRINDALTKFFGSLPVVDMAKIPEGWDIEKWLYFARKAGIAVHNSFKEGNKGASLGKMAGGMSGEQNVMNQAGLGDFIQQQINILSFVETQMGRIIGVPPQRLGDIQNRETVGGVERAVTQSSFITNELFKIHDNVKKRVLTLLLETCKIAFKDNPVKFQYIGDDYTAQIFEIDDEFTEEEFGILLDNENDLTKLEQQLESLVQAALQNNMLKFSDVMKIYTSSSMGEKQRLIEKSEEDLMKRQDAQAQREQQMAQAQLQQNAQLAEQQAAREDKQIADQLALDKYKIDTDNLTKRIIAEQSDKGVNTTDDAGKLELEYQKHEDELLLKMKDLNEKIRNNKEKEKLEGRKISKMSSKPTTSK